MPAKQLFPTVIGFAQPCARSCTHMLKPPDAEGIWTQPSAAKRIFGKMQQKEGAFAQDFHPPAQSHLTLRKAEMSKRKLVLFAAKGFFFSL